MDKARNLPRGVGLIGCLLLVILSGAPQFGSAQSDAAASAPPAPGRLIDLGGYRRWAFPLVVVGMNSIAMYCMSQLIKGWIREVVTVHLNWPWQRLLDAIGDRDESFRQHLQDAFGKHLFGGAFGPLAQSLSVLFVLWLICLWMYRRRIFLRI